MWLTIALRTSLASTSLPIPWPGDAVSLAITVRSRLFCRISSSMTRTGVPIPMKPPIMTLAPSGMTETDCSRETVCIVKLPSAELLCGPAAVDRQRRASNLSCGVRAQKHRQGPDLLRGCEVTGRLLFREQIVFGLIDRDLLARRPFAHLLLDQRRQHPAGTDRIAGDTGRRGLQCNDLGQTEHAVLGGDVSAFLHRCHQSMRRRDVDDASPVALAHLRDDRADGVKIG